MWRNKQHYLEFGRSAYILGQEILLVIFHLQKIDHILSQNPAQLWPNHRQREATESAHEETASWWRDDDQVLWKNNEHLWLSVFCNFYLSLYKFYMRILIVLKYLFYSIKITCKPLPTISSSTSPRSRYCPIQETMMWECKKLLWYFPCSRWISNINNSTNDKE